MPLKTTTYPAIPARQSELPTFGELWRRRGDGLSDSIGAWNRLCILPPVLRLTLLVSEFAFATHAMRENRCTRRLPSGLPFCLRSACRAQSTPALRTHALLPKIRFAPLNGCGLPTPGKLWSPSADSVQSPWEWVATAHPPGKHVPQTADKPTIPDVIRRRDKMHGSQSNV